MNRLKNSTFLKDILITFSGQVLVLLSNFLINKLVAIYVGVDQFGIFNIAKRSAVLIGFIILLELGISVPRYFSLYFKNNPRKAYEYYQLGLYLLLAMIGFSSILLFFNQKIVAVYIFGGAEFSNFVIPLLVYSIGIAINTFVFSAYRGAEYFYTYTMIQLLTQATNVLVIYIARSQGISAILLSWGISNILLSLLFLVLFSRLNSEFRSLRISHLSLKLKELLIYGIPRIPGEIIQFSYYLAPLMIINRKFGETFTGYFSASTGILQAFLPLFSYVGIVLLPKVSKALMSKKMQLVKKQVRYLSFVYMAFSLLIVLVGITFSKQIMLLLYSNEYTKHIVLANILLITLIPRAQFLLLRNPIDAISVKPINTVSLGISFLIMLSIMFFSKNIFLIAWSFVISDIILAVISIFSWNLLVNRKIREEND